MNEFVAGIGDLDSNAKGSGARRNDGKPDYSLIFFNHLAETIDASLNRDSQYQLVSNMCFSLGEFQRSGDVTDLTCAYGRIVRYAEQRCDEYVLNPVIKVWELGIEKYNRFNWAKGMMWSVPIGCIGRHVIQIIQGEEVDPESGQPHWAHVICNLQMLLLYYETYPEGNDLPYTFIEGGLCT